MIISNFSQRDDGKQFFIEADVQFESEPRSQKIFYAVPSAQASWLEIRPDAFMLGAAMAAMWAGETRLKIEATVDTQLAARLTLAMRLIAHWGGGKVHPLKIEADRFQTPAPSAKAGQTGIFLSGGVDSFAALLWNTRQYPVGHPKRVTVAFFVYGFDVGDPNKPGRQDVFESGREKLTGICQGLGVELLPIHVNLRSLVLDWRLYSDWQLASVLSSIAHAAGHRLQQVIIATDNVVEFVAPLGSHPWLNSYYSSDALAISSGDTEQFTRLERVRILADYPEVLRALRVCWMMKEIPAGALNCGHCSKCMRTLLELVACGAFPNNSAFPVAEVTPAMLKSTHIYDLDIAQYYEELPVPLRAVDRPDLAKAVVRKLRAWRYRETLGLNRLRPIVKRIFDSMRGIS